MPVWEVPRGFDPDEILNQENMEFSKISIFDHMKAVAEIVTGNVCPGCSEGVFPPGARLVDGEKWHGTCHDLQIEKTMTDEERAAGNEHNDLIRKSVKTY